MQPFELKIKEKDTIIKCLKVDNAVNYEDTIIKNTMYNNISTQTIQVTNSCKTTFVLPAQTLFIQQDNLGSTFKASIDNVPILSGQTVNVPVYYNGIYKGVSLAPVYAFILNGATVGYKLNVINNDILGVISNFIIEKNNGENHVYSASDFLSHYNDPDIGDTIAKVMFFGDVSRLRYNGLVYIEGQEIPIDDIQLGLLVYLAPTVDTQIEVVLVYKVRDTNNNIIE